MKALEVENVKKFILDSTPFSLKITDKGRNSGSQQISADIDCDRIFWLSVMEGQSSNEGASP